MFIKKIFANHIYIVYKLMYRIIGSGEPGDELRRAPYKSYLKLKGHLDLKLRQTNKALQSEDMVI